MMRAEQGDKGEQDNIEEVFYSEDGTVHCTRDKFTHPIRTTDMFGTALGRKQNKQSLFEVRLVGDEFAIGNNGGEENCAPESVKRHSSQTVHGAVDAH